ncbi:hypothetical protein M041_gp12 [Mycobacterium phage Severus]|uniref:hypothetical protein n=1 Tax=Mycobacterium phage Severus TaxID=1327776 RepID=UPI00032B3CDE|nr:hypothetical protein M041_gp12 [Mycobacterium phage Severus]AVO22473.1 hypothetical protein SEA_KITTENMITTENS_73 [Mycobacterium phage KittenMittens]QWS69358.1 hypothetical protein SEA_PEACEMEAL1_74 [Mycobacterium Phage PeaceMeal1]QZD97058.1 hypothetical protein SEA_DRAKE94_74 [Mycobacterium phage Drake94]USL89204.1 hypothetical protein SEA_POOMPHA_74 [Mycobacterium phage Poompha]AGK88007.1 hypothetical protein PBI_SEVERUS_75 [Mycobacterium phage Severus]
MFIATVQTSYPVLALAETHDEARQLAGEKALEFLRQSGFEFAESTRYSDAPGESVDGIEEYFGITVYEVPVGSARLMD